MKTTKIPSGWDATEKTIHRTFRTGSFQRGLGFVTKVAAEAEAMNHHPDVILTYSTVIITLMSHDVMRVTDKDLVLAEKINTIWSEFTKQ